MKNSALVLGSQLQLPAPERYFTRLTTEMSRIQMEKVGAEREVACLMEVEAELKERLAELKERLARKVSEKKKDKNLIKIVHQLCRPSASSASLRPPSPEILSSLADLNPSPVSSSSYQLRSATSPVSSSSYQLRSAASMPRAQDGKVAKPRGPRTRTRQ